MNVTDILDILPGWGIFLISLMITFLSIEFGLSMGMRRRKTLTGEKKIHAGTVIAASLSLLAFMIAIVFSTVDSRFKERKQMGLEEANAIGTAYLRADLLPKPDRAEVRQLLQDYVSLRIEAVQNATEEQIAQAMLRSEELQSELWSRAVTIAGQQPTPISALFVQSLNEMIDMHQTRITLAVDYRLPGSIWLVLYGLAILTIAVAGYDSGLSGNRRILAITLPTALAFSIVLSLLIMLDRPFQDLSMVSQAAMIDLQEDMHR